MSIVCVCVCVGAPMFVVDVQCRVYIWRVQAPANRKRNANDPSPLDASRQPRVVVVCVRVFDEIDTLQARRVRRVFSRTRTQFHCVRAYVV